jgi:UDP-glucose:(heptosyl)LPS alpha-1,3-glucosyltransferase
MKAALVLERFDPFRGGLETWTYRFAARLLELGHEVHVVAREFSDKGRALPIVPHTVQCGPKRLAFADAAAATLRPLAADVVHDMGVGWYCDLFHPHGGSWLSVTRRKLLLVPPGLRCCKRLLDPFLPRYREFQKLMARQYADRGQILVALSQGVAADFRQLHGVAAERIRIVHNGVDTEQFSPERRAAVRAAARARLGLSATTVVALAVAQNFALKGVPTLLRAIGRLRAAHPELHLVVVGGKRLGRWRQFARRVGAGSAVTFVGPVEDTLSYYAAADLCVHPTLYDTCSLVVLEAAACGVPVITTRCNGVADLFHDGTDSLIIDDPLNVGELAAAIEKLLAEPLRAALGRAARTTALANTFEHNVTAILALYEEIRHARAGNP